MTRSMEQAALQASGPQAESEAEATVAAATEAAEPAPADDAVASRPAEAATAVPIEAEFEPVADGAAEPNRAIDTERHHAIRHMQNRLEALGNEAVVVRMQSQSAATSDEAVASIAGRSGPAGGGRVEPLGRIPPVSLRAAPRSRQTRASGDYLGEAAEPWDSETAEALARIHEIEERSVLARTPSTEFRRSSPGSGSGPRPGPASPFFSVPKAPPADIGAVPNRSAYSAPAPVTPARQDLVPVRSQSQGAVAEQQTALARSQQYEMDKAWIDEQMTALVSRFEKSISSLKPDISTEALNTRFSEFEERLASALDGVAMKSDLENINLIEQHIVELSGQLDQTQTRLARLEGIEAQLQTVVEQIVSGREAQAGLPAVAAPTLQPDAADIERVAITVAENVAGHVQELILQIPAETGVPDFRGAIDRFMEERRIGEEQVVSSLATMQKAMVRVLDRIDAIEMAQYRNISGAGHPGEARRPPQPATAAMFPDLYQEPVVAAKRMPPPPEAPVRGPAKPGFDASNPAAVERARNDFKVDAKRARQKIANEFGDSVTVKFEAASTAGGAAASIGSAIGERRRLLVGGLLMVMAIVGAVMILKPSTKVQNGVTAKVENPAKPSAEGGHTVTPIVPDGVEPAASAGSSTAAAPDGKPAPTQSAPPEATPSAPLNPGPKAGAVDEKPPANVGFELQNPMNAPLGGDLAKSSGTAPAATPVAAPANQAVRPEDAPSAGNPNELPPLTVGPQSLRLAAAQGDASAEFEVGARLAEGKGTAQNFQEALRWYQRSATRGFAQAQYRLGTLYERGLGTPSDLGRARVWYQRAAEQGSVKAMHNLAVLSAGSANGQPDYPNAARWFRDAADRGLADSQFNIGVLYESGLGVEKDIKTAFKWFTLASAGGDVEAGKRRDALKGQLSTEDLAAAQKLVEAFQPIKVDPIVNDPRVAGEDWKTRQGTTRKADGAVD